MKKTFKKIGLIFLIIPLLSACNTDGEDKSLETSKPDETPFEQTDDDFEKQANDSDEKTTIEEEEPNAYWFETMTFEVRDHGDSLGTFDIQLENLAEEHEYELDEQTHIEILEVYPDYYLDQQTMEPASATEYPFNPAFTVLITTPDIETTAMIGIDLEVIAQESSLEIELVDYVATPVTYDENTDASEEE